MSDRWPGSLISPVAPVPTGGGAQDSASGIWTFEQAAPYIATQEWPGTGIPDPQFQYVTALLHGDGVNGGQNNTFLDSSPNNFTITRNGNTTQGSFSPYGNLWSTFGSYFTVPDNSAFDFGAGDFTIEGWINPPDSAQTNIVCRNFSASTGFILSTTNFLAAISSAWDISITFSNGFAGGQWSHFAVVRNGNVFTCYINGISVGTQTISGTIASSSGDIQIGRRNGQTNFVGYLSNLRIVKGTAVYTAAFTPPTVPLTAISGTSLLASQSNRFRDASTNNFTVTPVGTPSVQRFSPFQNLATYQLAVIGGSGYFDGSGDYLTVPNNAALQLGSSDFTIGAWVYVTATSASPQTLIAKGTGAGNQASYVIQLNSSGTWVYNISNNGATWSFADVPIGTNTLNTWQYIALVRSGNTFTPYLNGVAGTVTTSSLTLFAGTAVLSLGSDDTGSLRLTGYISDARVVKGTAIVPSTNPTAPTTAITNTQFLANFTNAAIFDSDASNNFETVGNAQISTSVVKYGTGSMAFDGSGDGLNAPDSPQFDMGSGNFTVEMWLYANSLSGEQFLVGQHNSSSFYAPFRFAFDGSRLVAFMSTTGSSWGLRLEAGSSLSTSTWYHIALVRNGTSFKIYVNGNQYDSGTLSGALYNSTDIMRVGWGSISAGVFSLNGYIDDLRITNGYARYWYNFQPPTRAFPNYGGTVIELEDPLFQYNTLLLNGNGTNGAQNNTFLDSSTNNFTITRNGNTTQGSFSPYGTLWGNFFNGSSSITVPDNAAFDYGSGDFTLECWIFPTATNNSVLLTAHTSGSDFGPCNLFFSSGALQLYSSSNNSSFDVANGASVGTPPVGQWSHVAVSRSGTSIRCFLNGSLISTTTSSATLMNATGTFQIASRNGGSFYSGYVSNFRVVKGTAVYTSAFTPSTTPLTVISGTSLLTCADNRFIDDSTNNFTITSVGSPSVQRFSPFEPTAPYSTSVIGGSGYFDGTTDYLSAANNAAFAFDTGDFTMECWYYSGTTTQQSLLDTRTTGNGPGVLMYTLSNRLRVYSNGGDAGGTVNIPNNSWTHLVVERISGALFTYVNGVRDINGSSYTPNLTDNSFVAGFDTKFGGFGVNGYLANMRIVKGTAIYSGATISVPTAPLTAVSGTSVLLNTINAGIPDLATQTNLETLGNAQVSTAQSQFGGSSLYFDGNTSTYLLSSERLGYTFGTGDFTVEAWIYPQAATNRVIMANRVGTVGTSNHWSFEFFNTANRIEWHTGLAIIAISNTNITLNAWSHVAVTRSSGTLRLFQNGQIVASASDTNNYSEVNPLLVGYEPVFPSTNAPFLGYMDDVRITKGIARYVQPFTPPTQAFQTF